MDLTWLKDDLSVIEKTMMAPVDSERWVPRIFSGLLSSKRARV